MARSRCSCGTQILWKADEPASDEWLLVAQPDLPDAIDWPSLRAASVEAAFCPGCGHLWVQWGTAPETIAEYAPTDPTVRPSRRK